ncbi:hypothetical protein ACIQPR_45090 [Streptomyces sp. NPDC091280]|uniref:hypothetical protein n=1 Tax=Streptomyces sp. NPDC091280 TaxID=3365984 RepID=UPI0038149949
MIKYRAMIDCAGWAMSSTHTEDRARIEAFHTNGAAIMITISPGRNKGARAYMLTPGWAWWRKIPLPAVEAFVTRLEIPPKAKRPPVGSPCTCEKVKYPTRDRAMDTLTDITIKRVIKRNGVQSERSAYRCPCDDRVWHVTSQDPRMPKNDDDRR